MLYALLSFDMTSPRSLRREERKGVELSEGEGSKRFIPRTASFSRLEEGEDDDDKTLVMCARSTTNTERDFGMKEFEAGDVSQEAAGLLEEETKSARRKRKLRVDTRTGSRNFSARMEKLGTELLEEVDLMEEEEFEGTWTVLEEEAVIKKMDRRVVLFVALLYLLSFLDRLVFSWLFWIGCILTFFNRSNIGNARIAGLEVDLQLAEGQYEWLLSGFYITYIAFEWMALLWVISLCVGLIVLIKGNRFRIFPPHIYISVVVLAWGLLASLQSLSTSFTTLLILRAALGVSEAAFAGIPFYLSFFFKREELASRVGVFISAAPLATTFASSLAWAITWLGSKLTLWAPWRLLFLVEGFPSVLVAAWVWRSLPDGPESAKFLSRRQKQIAQARVLKEGEDSSDEKRNSHAQEGGKKKLKMSEIVKALKDPKCYLTAVSTISSF